MLTGGYAQLQLFCLPLCAARIDGPLDDLLMISRGAQWLGITALVYLVFCFVFFMRGSLPFYSCFLPVILALSQTTAFPAISDLS